MIGQKQLKAQIDEQVSEGHFPRFSIITGPTGSGKKLIANYIADQLKSIPILAEDNKVATIKELINQSYKTTTPATYIIPDADDMSLAAKNILLKVTEEPPNNAYWIITLENTSNTLPTILSRGTVYHMNPYSEEELFTYWHDYSIDRFAGEDKILLKVCDNPGEIDLLKQYDVFAFYDFVNKVVDNIAEVSGANAFKIAQNISLKKGSTGYDLNLFWKMFRQVCINRLHKGMVHYSEGILVTNRYANELGIRGINKESLFDAWILDIRQRWM